ncbi:MAG: valine--tRNA ligase [Nitrospirota bacterium]
MSDLDTVYQPKDVEARWSRIWLERDVFRADPASPGAPYCIVIPPPNVTGSLHVGHALNNTLQDILVRWHRMRGDATLWQPGTDHAGIATQNVVERQLKVEGLSRDDLDRDQFIERVWAWRKESGGRIVEQLKRLGASCDWSRERFTMDEGLSAAVREVFVRLYHEGLIYRAERLINWCWRCGTALSDIEVEHEDVAGKMYHIRYPLADDPSQFLTVATTRPETMLGDTAVAVHPEDPRFNGLIGKDVALPLTTRRIPIVGDAILVDREFGTGAVKITPGHDFNDEKAGRRHGLDSISLLSAQGRINPFSYIEAKIASDLAKVLADKPVKDARVLVVERLERDGYLLKVEDHRHAIGKCYRCKTIVEPSASAQWFVNINDPEKSLAKPAIDAVRNGEIRLIPEGWVNNYLGWMNNIQDWCISRQIWWGHRIPSWYCTTLGCDAQVVRNVPTGVGAVGEGAALPEPTEDADPPYIIGMGAVPILPPADAPMNNPVICPKCGGKNLIQDPDVLDTWFSSALWPFSTLGWPQRTPELARFYPTSTLVTSFDILFFWVARMIMMGLKFMGDVPFRDVYIHALVRDAEGQKMSKSKGNVIDPLGIMDQYGTDALRFTLAAMASPGRDVKLSEQRIEGYRNFANKLWNASRFVLMNVEGRSTDADPAHRSLADRWITARLNHTIDTVTRNLTDYRFDEAANHLYRFVWHEFCDWYIELAKPRLGPDAAEHEAAATRATMVSTLETILRLMHPFMPFITEEIWQKIPHEGATIALAPYPKPNPISAEDLSFEGIMDEVISVISAIRTMRSELNIPPAQKIRAGLKTAARMADLIRRHGEADIMRLARLSTFQAAPDLEKPGDAVASAIPIGEVHIELEGIDLEKERSRLRKNLRDVQVELGRIDTKLKNPQFTAKAPAEVIADHDRRRSELVQQNRLISEQLDRLGGIDSA